MCEVVNLVPKNCILSLTVHTLNYVMENISKIYVTLPYFCIASISHACDTDASIRIHFVTGINFV